MTGVGPDDPCQRSTCDPDTPHHGRDHLDPTSPHYDGPDTMLNALPASCRTAAYALLEASERDRWCRQLVDTALDTLGREILRLRRQVAAVQVDRDRSVRAALLGAEDCATHGETIRHEGHQAYWFSRRADSLDLQRRAWIEALAEIDDAVRVHGPTELADWVSKRHLAAAAAQVRISRRYETTTLADCQRFGHCEHDAST